MASHSSVHFGCRYQPVHQSTTMPSQPKPVTIKIKTRQFSYKQKTHIPSSFSTYPPPGSSASNVTPPTTTEFSIYFGISILRSAQRPSRIFDGFKGLRQTLYPKLNAEKKYFMKHIMQKQSSVNFHNNVSVSHAT